MEFKLILKKLNNTLTKAEGEQFEAWISESETHRSYFEKVQNSYQDTSSVVDIRKGWERINSKIKSPKGVSTYWKYAAAAVIILLLTLPFVIPTETPVDTTAPQVVEESITIGTDKATLTLEDGTKVALEKGKAYTTQALTSNGQQLVYAANKDANGQIKQNTLTIPRGGQFYLVLADGTKVWLNSDTELKYPVDFGPDSPRKVELVYGEAYFEVSPSIQNNGTHFLVATQGQEVDVLGTEFNIKAFREDTFIETTLVNGKVAIKDGNSINNLSPGLQSKINKTTREIRIAATDVSNVISWKDGLFSFKNMPLEEIMKVLSRWYDVDVKIMDGAKGKITFNGVFNRNQELKNILSIIENTNEAKFKTQGKTIMVE
ncbi:FecR family protein [Muricauda sp. 2012CJ35-5]|uniref:FecR family protein n=1 Tax=Flagellimonas spongiicola TaxID=2942208 RepID=A0ABT0PQV7_9FLAO|nr:FecR family protein [Allomuricauda spongiicola]MCL6273777.1 FecR family protein [Allomuricauda spongiicola]